MAESIRNYELYWAKKPMNEMRAREGLPLLTPYALKDEIELEQGKVAEIAQKQRERWE